MPKRKRLLTPVKSRGRPSQSNVNKEQDTAKAPAPDKEETTPRGRLKGALLDALDADESDTSLDQSPVKKERRNSPDQSPRDGSSEEDDRVERDRSPPRQSYVLKLFDRSVDLSQFNEDSPLYPICRAWITNQPKANYKCFGKKPKKPQQSEDSVELPGPQGPAVSRIPSLLPEQLERNKDNINLNYREAAPPAREALLARHARRWAGVRAAWLAQAHAVEARYADTQRTLNEINVNAM